MPFSETEIRVGSIAYFTIDQLRATPDITRTGGSPDGKSRPFVCYAIGQDGKLYWTPITTDEGQPDRERIKTEWVKKATGQLQHVELLVNDGLHTYAGLPKEFASLSQAHDKFNRRDRPFLTEEGQAAVLRAVQSRGGQLPA